MHHILRRIAGDERGNGLLADVVVAGSFSLLVFQPTIIVAAVDQLHSFAVLFIGQLGFAF